MTDQRIRPISGGMAERRQNQGGLNLSGVLSSFAEIVAQVKTPLGFLTAALGIVGIVLVCFLAWDSTPAERKPLLYTFVILAVFEVIAVMVTVFWRPGNLYEQINTIEDFIDKEGIEDVIEDVIEENLTERIAERVEKVIQEKFAERDASP